MKTIPIYLFIDNSGSMYGEPIDLVNKGIRTLINSLRQDPYSLETCAISCISYCYEPKIISPLCPLDAIGDIKLEAVESGPTILSNSLSLLLQQALNELKRYSANNISYSKPFLIFLADGKTSGYDDDTRNLFKKIYSTFNVIGCSLPPLNFPLPDMFNVSTGANEWFVASDKSESIEAFFNSATRYLRQHMFDFMEAPISDSTNNDNYYPYKFNDN